MRPTAEELNVVEPLKSSLSQVLRRVRPLEVDQEHRLPEGLLAELGELGVFGLTLPTSHGGAGLSAVAACTVVAHVAAVDRSVATTLGLHLGLGTRGLVAFGSKSQHERWLPGLAEGRTIAAFATTESEAGSDVAAVKTTASVDGAGLKLSGTKVYVTNARLAKVLTLTAATPGLGGAKKGLSLLILDPATQGVSLGAEERKLGLRGSSTCTITLDDVSLGADAVVGEPGQGARQLEHVLSWGRLLLSAGCVGTTRVSLRTALAHVKLRKQFGKPLFGQEVVQRQLHAAAAGLFGMEAIVTRAARAEGDFAALARLTTASKVFCSERAWELCDLSLQLHGGAGFIEDTGVALPLRDARVTRIFEGANDVLATHAGLSELMTPLPQSPHAAMAELEAALAERRTALSTAYGVRAFNRRAALHALGRAAILRDVAAAATSLASSPGELDAAAQLRAQALAAVRLPLSDEVPLPFLERFLEEVLS